MALGRALFLRSQLDSARVVLEGATEAARASQDPATESDALTWWAYSLWQAGELEEARHRAEEALELKRRHHLSATWRTYNVLGLVAWWESRNSDAADLFRRAREAAEGDAEGLATAGANLALVLFEFGDFDGARTGFEAMRDYGRRAGDARLEGNALINLGMLDVNVGDPSAALPKLERARRLERSIGSVTGQESAIGHLGTAYAAMGELGRAYATIDTALMLARETGLRAEEAENLAQLAGLHAEAEDLRRALELYEESRAIDEELGLDDRVASDLREEAVLLAGMSDYPEGRRRAEKAWRIHHRVSAGLEGERDLLVLAELAHADGDSAATEEYLSAGETEAERIDARVARAEAALAAARIAESDHEPDRVLAILDLAEDDVMEGDYASEWEAEALRARAYLAVGQLAEAEASGRRAVEATERVRGGFASGILRSSYTTAKLQTYETLVTVLLLEGRDAQALELVDAARERRSGSQPDSRGVGSSPSSGTAPDEGEAILRRIDHLVESLDLYLNDPSPDARQTAEDLAARVTRARGEYERYLIRNAERVGGGSHGLAEAGATLPEIQQTLDEGEVLLEYLVGPDRLTIFAVTSDRLSVSRVDVSADDLASRLRLARELLADPENRAPASLVLERLHDLLLDPVVRSGMLEGARRLVVVPHEALAYLPLGALVDRATGRYVVEDYSILLARSAASFLEVRARGSRLSTGSTGATGVALAPFPDGLPASADEARTVAERMGSAPILGRRADERALRAALERGGHVHVATHGIMNPVNPLFSRIELAGGGSLPSDDGRMEVHEVLQMRIRAQTVFLSGCETGLGATWSTDFSRGEDYTTLAQAFLTAGAGSVVASLWRLDDPAAARLAARFYDELSEHSPADALARAQRAMIADSTYRAPFYWAAYQIAGWG